MSLRRRLGLLLACALGSLSSLAIIVATAAHADPYLPPGGKVPAGVTGGKDTGAYQQATGRHAPVFQFVSSLGAPLEWMFQAAGHERARLMIHVSTLTSGRETMTPAAIATATTPRSRAASSAGWRPTGRCAC